jgi:hypothetical protein
LRPPSSVILPGNYLIIIIITTIIVYLLTIKGFRHMAINGTNKSQLSKKAWY